MGSLQFRRRSILLPLLLFFVLLPVGFALPFFLYVSFELSPLQKQYFPAYMAMAMTGRTGKTFPVSWVLKTGPKKKPELATDEEVVAAPAVGRGTLPLALSPEAQAHGWTGLIQAKRTDALRNQETILQDDYFNGQSFARMMVSPLCGLALIVLFLYALREKFGSQSKHEERHGRRTKGPELVSAFRWSRGGKSDGIRFRLRSKLGPLGVSFRIPKKLEASHILLMGDTGSGKSNAIRQILRQVEERGEAAIVYDPAGEFVQEFYKPERGDFILNPLDERCPYWDLSGEISSAENADAIAAAMLPEKEHERGFFTDAPRRVLARLLRSHPSASQLLEWMSAPEQIEARLEGTPQAAYLDRNAGPQRGGVLASLNMIADSLALLPERGEGRRIFETGDWQFQRTRWVFLTSKPSMRERILPLHSAWLDLLILRMMEPCANPTKPVWFVLDELASLNKLPQLHTAVTENRKYGNPVVLGFQGRSQLEKRYGQDAEAMLSQPATKIFFKTSEPRAAKWISETLGEIEVERLKESRTPGLIGSKKNFAMEIATKPLVMASEIAGLEPLSGYIKQENRVTPVKFAFVPKHSLQPEFIERKVTIPEPKLLTPVSAEPARSQSQIPKLNAVQPTPLESPAKTLAPESLEVAPAVQSKIPLPQIPLLVEPAPEEPANPEPRKSAFKNKQAAAREWTPVD